MPWKTEVDRIVGRALGEGAKTGGTEAERAMRAALDLVELAPDRASSHFHLGAAEELMPEVDIEMPESTGPAERWRHLGRLDASARRGQRDRVRELMETELFDEAVDAPEGRVALRAVGRLLLRDGEDQRIFDYYTRHLAAHEDEGSRRDAEFLLEEALRRADRYERGERNEEAALARLDRAAAFVEAAKLDPRAGAKVDRKMGRVHQLAERWDDAAACYGRALERLPIEDPYRSVLVGDLALAKLNVRGTLDLLPEEERESRDEAIAILEDGIKEGEGRSYNAIYTLGVLRYEGGNHEEAAASFSEADELMRQNRAKARIVHARSRFLRAHCLLLLGAEGEDLETATRSVQKDAGPSNLPGELKDIVFDALHEAAPDARIPGRRGGGRKRGAAGALADARSVLERDPHKALEYIDRAFRSRPDIETWLGAYRTRLDALLSLEEMEEAERTWDRFRAKLFKGEAYDALEDLLTGDDSPVLEILEDPELRREMVDLYEVMPEREEHFLAACRSAAEAHLERGREGDAACAAALARALVQRGADGAQELLAACGEAATAESPAPSPEEIGELLGECEEPIRILVVGGDEGRRPHLQRFEDLQGRLGFEGDWIFTAARSPARATEEVEAALGQSDAMLLHPGVRGDLRASLLKLAGDLDRPVHAPAWLGADLLAPEVCRTLNLCFEEE